MQDFTLSLEKKSAECGIIIIYIQNVLEDFEMKRKIVLIVNACLCNLTEVCNKRRKSFHLSHNSTFGHLMQ